MKAIVNVDKSHKYAKFNGLTFDVVHIFNRIELNVSFLENIELDYKNVIIVDFMVELDNARKETFLSNTDDFKQLTEYAKIHNIQYK